MGWWWWSKCLCRWRLWWWYLGKQVHFFTLAMASRESCIRMQKRKPSRLNWRVWMCAFSISMGKIIAIGINNRWHCIYFGVLCITRKGSTKNKKTTQNFCCYEIFVYFLKCFEFYLIFCYSYLFCGGAKL